MPSRILVVDDDSAVRMRITLTLQEAGYDVEALADGVAGLEAAMHDTFDLVVTNQCMPRMSGDELTARLHQMFPGLPILRIGSLLRVDAGDMPAGEQRLHKPFSASALRQAVRALLNDRAR